MNGRTLLCICGLLLGVALTAGAQSMPMLGISTEPEKIDGVIAVAASMGGADSFVSFRGARAGISVGLAR